MSKTLTIQIFQDPTAHVERFLKDWLQLGSYEPINDVEFKLNSDDDKTCVLSMSVDQIEIKGDIPSASFMLIDKLAKACESDKAIEGEFIDKDQKHNPKFNAAFGGASNASFEIPFAMRQFGKISTLSKTKMVLLLIVAIPLLIIMIPIAIIVMIFKIIMFKLNFK